MRRALVLPLAALACHSANRSQRLARATVDTVDHHILRFTSTAPSAWPDTSGWKLVLVKEIKPEEGAPGEIINPGMNGTSLAWDDSERVWLVDQKPVAIKRYDATGNFVGQLGREGDGPGEYRNPVIAIRGSLLIADEDQMGIAKSWNGDVPGPWWIAKADFGGMPVYLDTLRRFFHYTSLPDPKTGVLHQDAWLRWPAPSASRSDAVADTIPLPLSPPYAGEYWWKVAKGSVGRPFIPQNTSIIDRAGNMVWGNTGTTTLMYSTTGHDTLRMIRLPDPTFVFSVSVRDSVVRAIANRVPWAKDEMLASAKGTDIAEHPPAWREITEDRAGNIWITRYGPDTHASHFDIVDTTGTWLGSVAVPPRFGRAFAIGRDHFADLVDDDAGRPVLRIFRIVKDIK